MKNLFELTLKNQELVDVIETEEKLQFVFADQSRLTIEDYHSQDCCESVYADFESVDIYKGQLCGGVYHTLIIQGVEEMGFLIKFIGDEEEKVLINCYNEQNGYYSSNLSLHIQYDNQKYGVDVTEFTQDSIS